MFREIRPTDPCTEILHDSLTFKEAREIVGGFIEVVQCGPRDFVGRSRRLMLVNEDAGNLSLSRNMVASNLYGYSIFGTVIVGERSEIEKLLRDG